MINRDSDLCITDQAKLLGISRGSVYYLPQAVSTAELALMRQIDELHLEHPFMGSRQLVRQLHRLGFEVGRLHVRTLMRQMGIKAMAPQPGSSAPAPGHKIYPYLLRNVRVERANQVWALDTTYVPMRQGFVYLTAIVDVATRRVMAHKVATTLEAIHATEIMQEALAKYGVPEIVNTDQGSQFTAQEFTAVVLESGAQLSMDGRGAWRDNVFVERLWRSVKYEHVYKYVYDSVADARAKVANYLDWYNKGRAHSSIGDQTPDEAYWDLLPKHKEAA
jgi:putative transposase